MNGKKFLSLFIAVVLCLTIIPVNSSVALASGTDITDLLKYTVKDGKATITYCDRDVAGNIVIPAKIDGYKVTEIGDSAFASCWELEGVTISNGIKTIGEGAFCNSGKIESVTIPASVRKIKDDAFYLCSGLKNISIAQGVTSIGFRGFSGCSALESIVLPESLKTLGRSAFANCRKLKSITVPGGVTVISDSLFSGCSSLENVVLHDGVTKIGSFSFRGCESLKSIILPKGVAVINDSAFAECTNLGSITIYNPETVISVNWETIPGKTIIVGYSGSTAQEYADTYKMKFNVLKDVEEDIFTGYYRIENGYMVFTLSAKSLDKFNNAKISLSYDSSFFKFSRYKPGKNMDTSKTKLSVDGKTAGKITVSLDSKQNFAASDFEICRIYLKMPEDITNLSNPSDSKQVVALSAVLNASSVVSQSFGVNIYKADQADYDINPYQYWPVEIKSEKLTWLEFTPKETGLYNLYSCWAYGDPVAYLYDDYGVLLAYNDNHVLGHGSDFDFYDTDFFIRYFLEAGKTYYFAIECKNKEFNSHIDVQLTFQKEYTSESQWKSLKVNSGSSAKISDDSAFILVAPGLDVNGLLKCVNKGATVIDKNASAVKSGEKLKSGMLLELKDGKTVSDQKIIVILGDLDNDGKLKAADARTTLRAAVGLEELSVEQNAAANVDGINGVNAADARLILRAAVGLENTKKWLKSK